MTGVSMYACETLPATYIVDIQSQMKRSSEQACRRFGECAALLKQCVLKGYRLHIFHSGENGRSMKISQIRKYMRKRLIAALNDAN